MGASNTELQKLLLGWGLTREPQDVVTLTDGDYNDGDDETSLGDNAVAVEFIATGGAVYVYTGAAGLSDSDIDTLIGGFDGMPWQPNLNFRTAAGIDGKASIYFKRVSATETTISWNVIRRA